MLEIVVHQSNSFLMYDQTDIDQPKAVKYFLVAHTHTHSHMGVQMCEGVSSLIALVLFVW